jgi:hypothetical protein
MYIQEKHTTEDLAVWARPFAFRSYGELTKKKKTKKKNCATITLSDKRHHLKIYIVTLFHQIKH